MFADKHLIPMLQNEAVRRLYHLIKATRVCPSIATIRTAYANTVPGSFMRQLMIDQVSLGLRNNSEIRKGAPTYVDYFSYSVIDVGSLGDVAGFTEDLAASYMREMKARDKNELVPDTITDYFVDEGADGKGVV